MDVRVGRDDEAVGRDPRPEPEVEGVLANHPAQVEVPALARGARGRVGKEEAGGRALGQRRAGRWPAGSRTPRGGRRRARAGPPRPAPPARTRAAKNAPHRAGLPASLRDRVEQRRGVFGPVEAVAEAREPLARERGEVGDAVERRGRRGPSASGCAGRSPGSSRRGRRRKPRRSSRRPRGPPGSRRARRRRSDRSPAVSAPVGRGRAARAFRREGGRGATEVSRTAKEYHIHTVQSPAMPAERERAFSWSASPTARLRGPWPRSTWTSSRASPRQPAATSWAASSRSAPRRTRRPTSERARSRRSAPRRPSERADLVIFDDELTPGQARNLEETLGRRCASSTGRG